LRVSFAAFSQGDVPGALAGLDPDVEVHSAPEVGNPGDFHGHDGFIQWAAQWVEAWDQFHQELLGVELLEHDVAIVDSHQVASGAGSGIAVERDVYWAIELRGTRATRLHLYGDRAEAVAAAESFRAEAD
jgi:ketosteroid isomerase-like protein